MNWLAIASADHVERGVREGFMQVCHGKGGPLRRIKPGDTVIYYSPTRVFKAADGLRSFTAFGHAANGQAYQADMGNGFMPFRLDVVWARAAPAPIRPLLDMLELTRGKSNWSYPFRFGLLPLSDPDRELIGHAMGVAHDGARPLPPQPRLPLFEHA